MAYGHSSVGAHMMFADAVGDNSYLYHNILKYYGKTMDFTPPDNEERFANATPMYDPKDTSVGGGISVSYAAYAQSWSTWLSLGLDAIGIKKVNAFINGNLLGQSFHMNTIDHASGMRSSSEAAYLRPVLSRKTLALFDNTMVQRIIFNHRKEAIGAQIGSRCIISARKEVLLSAGVFQSPQMLMVSGVGPKDLLHSLDIHVVADRPGVGQNLREHIVIFLSHQVSLVTGSKLSDPEYLAEAITDFNDHAAGPLTSVGGDMMAMEKIPAELRTNFSPETNKALDKLPADWPEIAYAFLPVAVPPGYVNTSVAPVEGGQYATTVAVLFAPQSVGNVSISSSDNSVPPLINPALFTHPADVDLMIAGFKRVRQAHAAKVMGPVLVGPETVPGEQVQTDEEILDFLRHGIQPFQHAFSSNKMGKANDPMAVVDSRGRVYGVKRRKLRLAEHTVT
jgi:choline dehydrogenase